MAKNKFKKKTDLNRLNYNEATNSAGASGTSVAAGNSTDAVGGMRAQNGQANKNKPQ